MNKRYTKPLFRYFSALPAEEIGLDEGPTASDIPVDVPLIPEDEW